MIEETTRSNHTNKMMMLFEKFFQRRREYKQEQFIFKIIKKINTHKKKWKLNYFFNKIKKRLIIKILHTIYLYKFQNSCLKT